MAVITMSKNMDKSIDPQPHPKRSEATMSNAQGVMFMIQEIQKEFNQTGFAVGVLVGLLTLFLIFVWYRKGGLRKLSKRAILIAGPSDAGKTILFSQLVHQKPIETFTSMIENVGQYSRTNTDGEISSNAGHRKTLNMYDLPGHDRIRYAALEKRKEEAKAIIYVIDASTIKQKLRDSAEFLFNVLRDPCLNSSNTPVLVVCNKQDLGIQAKGAGVIERELAKEIGLLRVTKSRLLEDSAGNADGNTNVYLGKEGKDFEFSDLRAEVKFVEASAAKGYDDEESGISAIQLWIASKA